MRQWWIEKRLKQIQVYRDENQAEIVKMGLKEIGINLD